MYDLRLRKEEFWGMVPRQFFSLMERHREAQIRSEYPSAIVATVLLKTFGAKKVKPADFMPSYREPKEEEVSWQDLLGKVQQIHKSVGGA